MGGGRNLKQRETKVLGEVFQALGGDAGADTGHGDLIWDKS